MGPLWNFSPIVPGTNQQEMMSIFHQFRGLKKVTYWPLVIPKEQLGFGKFILHSESWGNILVIIPLGPNPPCLPSHSTTHYVDMQILFRDVTSTKLMRSMRGHTDRIATLDWNEHILASGSRR